MLDITKPSAKSVAEPTLPVTPIQKPSESVSTKGTIVVLSPDAIKLSRDLQAVQNDPDKDPAARMDASVQLRKMAAQILTAK